LLAQKMDFEQLARDFRPPMLRFAQLHLPRREDAEDAVQDVLTAMLATDWSKVSEGGIRTYLFGILRHKITDRLRHKYRGEIACGEVFEDDLDDMLFTTRGHWSTGVAPGLWSSPDGQLETEQFFAVVDLCVNRLPPKPARVFSMRELRECGDGGLCNVRGRTHADDWQCMSRARKQLQLCLNQRWFGGRTS